MPGVQNRCIKIVSTKLTWDAAMGTCRDLGGTLATLDTPSRNAFVIGNLALITGKMMVMTKSRNQPTQTNCNLYYNSN